MAPLQAPDMVVVTCTHPSAGAEALARALVEGRLAACVQVGAPLRSIYQWQGSVESTDEVRLDIKTTAGRLEALAAEIRRLHPYEVPEILATRVAWGSEAYLEWLRAETEPR